MKLTNAEKNALIVLYKKGTHDVSHLRAAVPAITGKEILALAESPFVFAGKNPNTNAVESFAISEAGKAEAQEILAERRSKKIVLILTVIAAVASVFAAVFGLLQIILTVK